MTEKPRGGGIPDLPDREARDRIESELDRSFLVEAAAGTGKTTSMVRRMSALLGEGRCQVEQMAAVTFTRKAAAELRSRFQTHLEEEARNAGGEPRERLNKALENLESCFIGTIHSFCARLLRERPVEAGVPTDFREMEDEEDDLRRRENWEDFVGELLRGEREDPALPTPEELEAAALEPADLEAAYDTFSRHADIDDWPAAPVDFRVPPKTVRELLDYAAHMRRTAAEFPRDPGRDKLMPLYRRIGRLASQLHEEPETVRFMELIQLFSAEPTVVKRNWPGETEQADREQGRWNDFRERVADPLLVSWREHRYHLAMLVLRGAEESYRRLRREHGLLNYQDLLTRASRLLAGRPKVRDYFRKRFDRVLVDEFQDTDPAQAEVLLYLTADDPGESDWRACLPRPGSLFVVGDPKQSIYRFRRADIVTYAQVKERIRESGGDVLHLAANFRSARPLLEWVNAAFAGRFPGWENEFSPAYEPLLPSPRTPAGDGPAVLRLEIPADVSTKAAIVPFEAELVAREIARSIREDGKEPKDFMILTRTAGQLASYAEALRRLGIRHEVTGGNALNRVIELRLLGDLARALLSPGDRVALLAVLRGEIFGFADDALHRFVSGGGRISLDSPVPGGLAGEEAERFREAFSRLSRYRAWFDAMPPTAALERVSADLGLTCRAATGTEGNGRAGALGKAFELLRLAGSESWSSAGAADLLACLTSGERPHDAPPARPHDGNVVRVMNLHKAKGLEADTVFLADPTGFFTHAVEFHVDRSGPSPKGYLAVREPARWNRGTIVGHPPGWSRVEELERQFLDAEETRLLYVAATRAKSRLVISRRVKRANENPWQSLAEEVEENLVLQDPGAPPPFERPVVSLKAEEAGSATAAVRERWAAVLRPTRSRESARELALEPGDHEPVRGAGRGAGWGTVIHLLLENAVKRPGCDLPSLANRFLSAEGIDIGGAAEAADGVARVLKSPFWERVRNGDPVLAEVPVQAELPAGDGRSLPTLVRGVIDLAFRERDGWVIVDYKTDDEPGKPLDQLVERYAPQVALYSGLWGSLTGETVAEAGLFFVNSLLFVAV